MTVAAVLCLGVTAWAQRGFGFGGPRGPFRTLPNTKYDGRFNFVRVVYDCDPSGYWYRGLPSWAHGYPMAERNLMKIMNEVPSDVAGIVVEVLVPNGQAVEYGQPLLIIDTAG